MEVKDFVAQTIIEIIAGVKLAQEYAIQNGAIVNAGKEVTYTNTAKVERGDPLAQKIDFDIYLTTSDNTKTATGVQVFFPKFFGAGGDSQNESGDRTANRVRFSVPVVFTKQSHPEQQ